MISTSDVMRKIAGPRLEPYYDARRLLDSQIGHLRRQMRIPVTARDFERLEPAQEGQIETIKARPYVVGCDGARL